MIIREDICAAQKEAGEAEQCQESGEVVYPTGEDAGKDSGSTVIVEPPPQTQKDELNEIHLRFTVPKGKVAGLMGVMNLLQTHFRSLQIELSAEGGIMSNQDYEDKIKEAFMQLGIPLDE